MRWLIPILVLGFVILVPGFSPFVEAQSQQRPPAATFRSRITLVPVDVRVLDADGRPMTGLTADDFTVIEDGRRQEIRHFSEYALSALAPEPGAGPAFRQPQSAGLAPPKQRIFLIVLGRGRLQEPSKGMDALVRFVREQLLPQDQVALLAWNRATSFTTDHQKIAASLERIRRGQNKIEALITQQFSGLQALYGGREVSASTQREIDRMLGGQDAAPTRKLPTVSVTDAARLATDMRKDVETLVGGEIATSHGDLRSPFDESAVRAAERFEMSLEEYASTGVRSLQDLDILYTGIEYLRYLEGEKHLVFVTVDGVVLPRLEDDLSIAALANDARVVLDTVQTGGIPGPAPSYDFKTEYARTADKVVPTTTQRFALVTLKTVSELTGGVASVMAPAAGALDRINQTTLSGYVLGYYPSNAAWDGKYRKIDVKVNRPGAVVLFRHGYYGRDQLVPLDRKAFLTFNRVAAAAYYDRDLADIPVRAKISMSGTSTQAAGEAVVEVTIDLSKVAFTRDGDRYVASLDINVFCGDDQETVVGESWETSALRLKEETYQRLRKSGFVYTARVPLKGKVRYAKVVVYDYESDRLGSAVVKVR
jgi:VWFA-related protein